MSEILRITRLQQVFTGTTVLDGIDLALQHRDRLAVIGASGSGKSTLLRLIAGLEVPTRGEIRIDGAIVSRPGQILVPPERREVAVVFQGLALFPHLRALDQIAFAAKGRGGIEAAKALLERIGLGHRANAPLDQLSGGERQRIALARAMAQRPKMILMDEPFASLDDQTRAQMRDLLRSLLDESGATLVLVTHSRDDALDLARRALVLDAGRPVACDALANILAEPRRVACVRCLGLGQIIDGIARRNGTADTAFGRVVLEGDASPGPIRILIRPAQPQIYSGDDGVDARVVEIQARPPDLLQVRHVAVLCAGESIIRSQCAVDLRVGDRVKVRISGVCQVLSD